MDIKKIEKSVPGKLYYKDETKSTNLDAKVTENVPDKSVFLADRQTNGRGRLGRDWSSPSEVGIWMSIYLKPQCNIEDVSKLTLIAGIAVARTIDGATIKWPNDILIGDKKLAGILTEMSVEAGKIKNVVVGIGVNVNNESFSDELSDKATSLYMETGRKTEREKLIFNILTEFFCMYDVFLKKGFSAFVDEYTKKCVTIGKEVFVIKEDEKSLAKALSITENGELLVEINGKEEIINSSEVSVRGLLGYV